jgi:sulfur carrier protein ThiS
MGTNEMGVVTVELYPVKDGNSLLRVALQDGMTLDDLMESLRLSQEPDAVIVNGIYVKPDYRLQDGDRVSIFPILSGG